MALILIAPHFFVGHIHPTMAIARDLVRRGHRVVYWSAERSRPVVEAQGFPFVSMLPDILDRRPRAPRAWLPARARKALSYRFGAATIRQLWEAVLSGRAARELEELGPDVVAVDNLLPHIALAAREIGIPSVQLATSFVRAGGRDVPASVLGSRVRRNALRVVGADLRSAPPLRELARRCAIPETAVDARFDYAMLSGSVIPELCLFPPDLEIDDPGSACHGGPTIDVDRVDGSGDDYGVMPGQSLVYASLGTLTAKYPGAQRLLRSILAAIGARPRLHLLLATGRGVAVTERVPANCTIREHVPQLDVLRRAAAVITHGGLGTLKECIYFGVPMVVAPFSFDQFGNAERVAHHRIGVVLRRHGPSDVSRALDRVLEDRTYGRNLERMSANARSFEAKGEGTRFIERLAGGV